MGIPLYLQSAGEGKDAEEVDLLRREVRRLRVGNASEVREIGKLKQMRELQQHLAGDWSTLSGADTKQVRAAVLFCWRRRCVEILAQRRAAFPPASRFSHAACRVGQLRLARA